MPVLDMPLHELKTYQGRNPRPADIDAFWDASVAEMEALGTAWFFKLLNIRMTCYTMFKIEC